MKFVLENLKITPTPQILELKPEVRFTVLILAETDVNNLVNALYIKCH